MSKEITRNKLILLTVLLFMATLPGVSFADTVADRKIVVSKAYVDTTKQNKISATSNGASGSPNYVYDSTNNPTAAGSVVTTTDSAGVTGERGIATEPTYDTSNNLTNDSWIPTMGAVMTAIDSHVPTGTENTLANYDSTGALGSGIATYDGSDPYDSTNDSDKIATAGFVATKQDLIEAENVLLLDSNGDDIPNDIYVPSMVTTSAPDDTTLVGNQVGILSYDTLENTLSGWWMSDFNDRDDLVPTVAAIAPELADLWGGIDNVYNAKQDILTKQLYTTLFNPTTDLTPAGGETIDIRGDNTNSSVGRRYITGTGSQALTTKSGADTVLSYVNGTKSLSAFQTSNFGASGKLSADLPKNNAYIRGALVSLELLKDTYAELDSKISDAVSAIDFDTLTWDSSETAAANAYSTTFSDSGTNTWPESDEDKLVDGAALATALSLKQNKVATGLVLFDDQDGTENDVYVPALVATDSTGSTINGNTIGIVPRDQILGGNGVDDNMMTYLMNIRYKYDNFVPTLSALGVAYTSLNTKISNIQWTALELTSDMRVAINVYDTSNSSWWPSATNKLANAQFMKEVLAMKQNKLTRSFTGTNADPGSDYAYRPVSYGGEAVTFYPTATSTITSDQYNWRHRYVTADGAQPLTIKTGADNVILYVNGTKTLSEFQLSNFGNENSGTISTQNNFIKGALVSLELLKDVYSELNTKITAVSRPTGTTGTVATYNGVTNGVQQFTETAIYDPTNTYSSSDSGKLATAGFVETKQNKIPAKANGDPTKIVTYPAYGSAAGAIGELSVDTSTLYTTDDSHVPSSKLVSTSLAGKQDTIPAGNALFLDNEGTENDLYLPGLVAYDSTTQSLKGDQIGILSYGNMQDWQLDNILTLLDYPLIADKAVPTVGSVAASLANLANSIENAFVQKQNVLSPQFTATTGKTDLVPAGGETIAFDPESDELSPRYITGAGTEGLTTKTGANSVIDYVNGTVTLDGMQISNFGALFPGDSVQLVEKNKNYIKKALVSLETLKDVYSELNTKITANSRPTGTLGTVATYNGVTNGVQQFTGTAIYDPTNTYSSSDSGKLATAGFVETKQSKIPAKANGDPTKIVTYPAYGSAAGAIGELSVDTSTLYTTDDSHVPSSKLVSTSLAGKQDTIPVTSNGSNNTPNYVYDSSTNPTAAGSVVTTTDSAGVTGERGIATEPTYDTSNNLTNDSWIPTMGAVMNQISSATNTLTWDTAETTAANAYETHFGSGTNYWPATDETKLINTAALAQGLALKQNKIAATVDSGYHSVLTDGDTDGAVGKLRITTSDDVDEGDTLTSFEPTDDEIMTGAAVAALAQDKIPAENIVLLEEDGEDITSDIYVPSMVTTSAPDDTTLVGTQFGILSNSVIDDADIGWEQPYLYDFSDRDDLVPTVAAITPALNELWDGIDNVYNAKQDILPAKFSKVSAGSNVAPCSSCGQTIGLTGSEGAIEYRYITGGAINPLTTRVNVGLKPLALTPVLDYINGTVSLADFQTNNFGGIGGTATTNQNYIKNALVSLETLKDVYAELNSKISDAVSAIDFDTLTWDSSETAAANAYSTTFSDSGTNTWPESDEDKLVDGAALATALSLKQNKVATGLVEFYDGGNDPSAALNVRALVATDSTGSTINGNTIGIVGASFIPVGDTIFGYLAAKYDNFVPTLRTMARELGVATDRLDTDEQNTLAKTLDAINAYSTTFDTTSTHVNGNWPINSANQLINVHAFSHGLALKQNKIPAKANGDPTKIVTYPAYGSAAGAIGELSVDTSTLNTTDNTSVPSSKLVSTSLAGKQDAITTDKVLVAGDGTGENDIYVPAIVTTNAAGTALTGNSVGLLTYEVLDSAGLGLEDYDLSDDLVPTTAAVMQAIGYKQDLINSTDESFVYDLLTNRYADGSVIVTTADDGHVDQRGIATAPVSDGNGGYSNGDWLPTVNAMMTAIAGATPTISGTANTIANYDSTGALGSGIATYNGSGYNSSTDAGKIATAAAVETKVSKTQSTGYQVLTTGTTGTVTAEYLAVPVTTSGTGRPAANNAPTGTAAIWIE